LRNQVSSCYANANENEETKARRKARDDEEDAEDAKRKSKRDSRNTRDNEAGKAAEESGGGDFELPQEDAPPIAQSPSASVNPYAQSQGAHIANGSASASSKAHLPSLVDPFGGTASGNPTREVSELKLADPFAPTLTLVDPFKPNGSASEEPAGPSSREVFDYSSHVAGLGADYAQSVLNKDISYVEAEAGKTINRHTAEELIQDIHDTSSLVRTLDRFRSGGEYLVLLKDIATVESQGKKDEAWGNLVSHAGGDVLHTDLVKEGVTRVATRLFGEEVGLLLAGVAGVTAEGGGIALESTKTGQDATEIIRDTSGKNSLAEKQSALMNMWETYGRTASQVPQATRNEIRRELWINSNVVYNECLEAKADCEHAMRRAIL